jgi:dsRNA-specific ribonuclease
MYNNKLQELCQKNSYPLLEYQTTHEGPLHNPLFSSTVTVKSISFTSPEPASTLKASQEFAAMVAFHHFLQNENNS